MFAVPDLTGRTVLVTGTTSGLGLAASRALAQAGARVLMAARDAERGRAAAESVGGELVLLDLADLSSVRRAAAEVRERTGDRLDVLLNNAGIAMGPRRETADGFELQIGTNHLGPAALTWLLMPALRAAAASPLRRPPAAATSPPRRLPAAPSVPSRRLPAVAASPPHRLPAAASVPSRRLPDPGTGGAEPARVVTTSSLGHRTGAVDVTDLHWRRRRYRPNTAYGTSKLANLLFAAELDRRLRLAGDPVLSVAAHPGMTESELLTNGTRRGWTIEAVLFAPWDRLLTQPVEDGVGPQLAAATGPVHGGDYLGPTGPLELRGPPGPARRSAAAQDPVLAARLWAATAEAVGVAPDQR